MTRVSLLDFEQEARARLTPEAWDYYASGADAEVTLHRNVEAFARLTLYYRVLVDVSQRDASTTLLGERISCPVVIAPTAFHKLAHADGEIATARAAAEAGTIMILSTLSNTRVEDVVAATTAPVWFQLYVYRDRDASEALVRRVEAAGCRALVLTVDAPMLGRREPDVRNRFALPAGLRVENMHGADHATVNAPEDDSGLSAYFARLIDPSFDWKALRWLRSITHLPVWVKGIVRADDARRAVDAGVHGIVVSNHGGRQLDTAPATIDALGPIADAVGDRTTLLLDGGVRRGTDVLKALALGARAVLLGRPVLWGLAAGGERGVVEALRLLRDDLDRAMALCGCATLADVTRDLVVRP